MMPIGPLMIEHRLIERMVDVLDDHLQALQRGHQPDLELLRTGVDFFRVYADRTHHGKEEDILFHALATRPLSDEHRQTMGELIDEHKTARRLVGALGEAARKVPAGDGGAVEDICDRLRELVALYRPHIEKEDKHFFVPVMEYLSDEDRETMLEAFQVFDAGMIHEKYRQVVAAVEPVGEAVPPPTRS